jgi:RNA polymerase sigma factor (sigma-70 family)
VNSLTDQQLLRDYTSDRSEVAFAELVQRHVDLVYSAALRMVCDSHLAEDVTQAVFVALAKNAAQLTDRPVLSGWLHRTAQNIAAQTVRTDVRRRAREQEAAAMNELLSTEPDAVWEHIEPHLDAALGELSEPDRDALLLRYFERKSAREMAQTLGISDDAAQKRVSRAVERLREFFAKRGVTVGTSGLVVVISANAVQAAPVGLAVTISAAAALAGTTLAATATATALKTIAMTKLQKTIIGAALAAAVGTGIYEARQASTLRTQLQALQQQAPPAGQIEQLTRERDETTRQLAALRDDNERLNRNTAELLKLRGKSSLAQTQSREIAQLKSTLAQQTGKMPDFIQNSMAAGAAAGEKMMQKDALARVSRMKQMLNLTDAQEQAISNIMTNRIPRQSQLGLDMLMGKLTPEQVQAQNRAMGDQEAEIKALLTPEQLAAYPEYKQAEKTTAADTSAKSEASQIADKFSLPKDQQEQLRAFLYEMNLKEPAGAVNQAAIAQAKKSGNLAEAAKMSIELENWQLEEKLKILEGILSPEQMTTYRQEQTDRINKQADMMKMFLPQKPAETTN